MHCVPLAKCPEVTRCPSWDIKIQNVNVNSTYSGHGDQHFSIQHDRNIQAEKGWIQKVKIIITSNAWILPASERTLNMEKKEKNRTAVEHAVHVQQRE